MFGVQVCVINASTALALHVVSRQRGARVETKSLSAGRDSQQLCAFNICRSRAAVEYHTHSFRDEFQPAISITDGAGGLTQPERRYSGPHFG